jgi:hypothetical protein
MNREIEWTQLELSTTSYKGATSVLLSVTLLIKLTAYCELEVIMLQRNPTQNQTRFFNKK